MKNITVFRQNLVSKVNTLLNEKYDILVSAPSGYGKNTLINSYIEFYNKKHIVIDFDCDRFNVYSFNSFILKQISKMLEIQINDFADITAVIKQFNNTPNYQNLLIVVKNFQNLYYNNIFDDTICIWKKLNLPKIYLSSGAKSSIEPTDNKKIYILSKNDLSFDRKEILEYAFLCNRTIDSADLNFLYENLDGCAHLIENFFSNDSVKNYATVGYFVREKSFDKLNDSLKTAINLLKFIDNFNYNDALSLIKNKEILDKIIDLGCIKNQWLIFDDFNFMYSFEIFFKQSIQSYPLPNISQLIEIFNILLNREDYEAAFYIAYNFLNREFQLQILNHNNFCYQYDLIMDNPYDKINFFSIAERIKYQNAYLRYLYNNITFLNHKQKIKEYEEYKKFFLNPLNVEYIKSNLPNTIDYVSSTDNLLSLDIMLTNDISTIVAKANENLRLINFRNITWSNLIKTRLRNRLNILFKYFSTPGTLYTTMLLLYEKLPKIAMVGYGGKAYFNEFCFAEYLLVTAEFEKAEELLKKIIVWAELEDNYDLIIPAKFWLGRLYCITNNLSDAFKIYNYFDSHKSIKPNYKEIFKIAKSYLQNQLGFDVKLSDFGIINGKFSKIKDYYQITLYLKIFLTTKRFTEFDAWIVKIKDYITLENILGFNSIILIYESIGCYLRKDFARAEEIFIDAINSTSLDNFQVDFIELKAYTYYIIKEIKNTDKIINLPYFELLKKNIFKYFNENTIVKAGNLTGKEKHILFLLSKDLTRNEIAEKLYISAETVKSHISNIYKKLNAGSKGEAIQIALKYKLFD